MDTRKTCKEQRKHGNLDGSPNWVGAAGICPLQLNFLVRFKPSKRAHVGNPRVVFAGRPHLAKWETSAVGRNMAQLTRVGFMPFSPRELRHLLSPKPPKQEPAQNMPKPVSSLWLVRLVFLAHGAEVLRYRRWRLGILPALTFRLDTLFRLNRFNLGALGRRFGNGERPGYCFCNSEIKGYLAIEMKAKSGQPPIRVFLTPQNDTYIQLRGLDWRFGGWVDSNIYPPQEQGFKSPDYQSTHATRARLRLPEGTRLDLPFERFPK